MLLRWFITKITVAFGSICRNAMSIRPNRTRYKARLNPRASLIATPKYSVVENPGTISRA